jgi:hypothetical protein
VVVSARVRNGWVFSPRLDALAFGGPIVVSGVLVAIAAATGTLHDALPVWGYLLLVVGCDVAHVYATAYRTYLDPIERARHPTRYLVIPLACLVAGVALHVADPVWFWRALAYLAAFHFVRQAWGFMAYSARRAGETSRVDRALDQAAIYAATVAPLVWWHAHLPRAFVWFTHDDFVEIPEWVGRDSIRLQIAILAIWVARQGWLVLCGRPVNLAKALVLSTTWLAWTGGIVLLESDLAFTASNVLAHGVPYFVLLRRWGSVRYRGEKGWVARLAAPGAGALSWMALLVAAAYLEEGLWDRLYAHAHPGVFPGPAVVVEDALAALIAGVLVVPQATHYVLDAFLWRTAKNPGLAETLGLSRKPSSTSDVPAKQQYGSATVAVTSSAARSRAAPPAR